MKKLILIFLIGFTICSCSNDDDSTSLNLVGTWNWVRSSGGITGAILTPASTGSTMRLEITSTVIKKYMDNDLISERTYSIQVRESSIFGEPRDMIIHENNSRQIIDLEGTNLTLIGDCNDCFTSNYEKE